MVIASRTIDTRARRGQAFVEMTISLIAIVVLIGVFLQIGILGYQQTQAIMEATEEASEGAVADDYMASAAGLDYISRWNEGPDDVAYSTDDRYDTTSPQPVYDDILEVGHPDELEGYIGENEYSDAYNNANLMEELSMVRERVVRPPTPILPVVRALFYDDDSISMEAEVVFTWTKGLY